MFKQIFVALAFAAAVSAPCNIKPEVSAKSAVLIEAETGRIVYEKNADEKLPMASTTKIMSALIALEYCESDKPFIVDPNAIKVEGSSMGLKEGDTVTMRTLACGMLLASGNDAANAAAVALCGSVEGFVGMMNDKAELLGLDNTSFATPSGLDSENHYSTAEDMAHLAAYALANPDFAEICSQKSMKLSYGNPPYDRWLKNHNRLLSDYDGCIGVKTGFTKKAGRCLVSAAQRDGVTLICVTLNAPSDWQDHKKLFDYGFENYKQVLLNTSTDEITVPVAGGNTQAIGVNASSPRYAALSEAEVKNIKRTVNIKRPLFAPVCKGDEVGTMEFSLDGNVIKSVPLFADRNVEYAEKPSLWQRLLGKMGEQNG